MGKKRIFADRKLECTVCGNNVWRHTEGQEEEPEDFHYWITASTDLVLRERKQKLGSWESTFRTILAGYDAYNAIQERQRIREMTGLRTLITDVSQEE